MKTLIISDLDGTLLNTDIHPVEVPEELKDAIVSFMEEGNFFTIATGRTPKTLLPFLKEIPINVPFICSNGGWVQSPEGEILERATIPKDLVKYFYKETDLGVLFFTEDKIYFREKNEWTEKYKKKEETEVWPFPEGEENEIIKILLVGEEEKLKKYYNEQDPRVHENLHSLVSESYYLEIIPKGICKGFGVERLLDHLGEEVRTVAIGNQMNDVAMLQRADEGYCVNNAAENVRKMGFSITHGSYSAGVLEILEKYSNKKAR